MDNVHIRRWNQRARRHGLAGNLTLTEWEQMLAVFQRQCAYCRKRAVETLDHFVPLAFGGGSTSTNSVPSCLLCNQAKADQHPDQLTMFYPEALAQVRTYLQAEGQRLHERAAERIQRFPYLAHGQQAAFRLKAYCQEQVQTGKDTAAHYALLLLCIL